MRPAGTPGCGAGGWRRLKRFVETATTLERMAKMTITTASILSLLVANKGLSLHYSNKFKHIRKKCFKSNIGW